MAQLTFRENASGTSQQNLTFLEQQFLTLWRGFVKSVAVKSGFQ